MRGYLIIAANTLLLLSSVTFAQETSVNNSSSNAKETNTFLKNSSKDDGTILPLSTYRVLSPSKKEFDPLSKIILAPTERAYKDTFKSHRAVLPKYLYPDLPLLNNEQVIFPTDEGLDALVTSNQAPADLGNYAEFEITVKNLSVRIRDRIAENLLPAPGAQGPILPDPTDLNPSEKAFANAQLSKWAGCKTAGQEIWDNSCNLATDDCLIFKANYRDSCFSLVQPDQPFMIAGTWTPQPLKFSNIMQSIAILVSNGKPICTGVFINKSHVLTAAHCRKDIELCAALGSSCKSAFFHISTDPSLHALDGRLTNEFHEGNPTTDFDIWKLSSPAKDAESFPIAPISTTDSSSVRIPSMIVGAAAFNNCNTTVDPKCLLSVLWRPSDFTGCSITCKTASGALLHDCQTIYGLSGAPILVISNGRPSIAGIHSRSEFSFKPQGCPGESQVAVSMTHICQWIQNNHPELSGEACHEP